MATSNSNLGFVALQICAAHCALILGVWGPKAGLWRHWWVPSPAHELGGVTLLFFIGIVQYMGIAVLEFGRIESNAETDVGGGVIMPEGTFKDGTIIDKIWFCFVLLTTVGYGNTFVPTTPASRNFVIVWALFGLFLFGAGSSVVQAGVGQLAAATSNAIKRVKELRRASVTSVTPSSPPDGSAPPPFEPGDMYYIGRGLYIQFGIFLIINFGGAYIFMHLDPNMTFQDGFYHCVMTATTIGLGDIAPTTQSGRLYGIVHMLLSVGLFTSILGTIIWALERRVHSMRKAEMLQRQLEEDLITSLDRDGNGVDKAEFVCGMLEKLGVLTKEDFEPFFRQFDELDVTGEGLLSREDLAELAHINQQKAVKAAQKKEEASRSTHHKAQGHAAALLVPSFLASFGFMWCTTFGYILLVSGLLNATCVGTLVGSEPSIRSYKRAMWLAFNAAVALIVAIVWCGNMVFNTGSYMLYLDPLFLRTSTTYFDGEGITRPVPPAVDQMIMKEMETYFIGPSDLVLIGTYVSCFIYAIGLDFLTCACCYKCIQELRASNATGGARHPPSPPGPKAEPWEAYRPAEPEPEPEPSSSLSKENGWAAAPSPE